MEEWYEFATICDPNPVSAFPITTCAFDPHAELIWIGDENGRVCSYDIETLEKYTSFKGHTGPVRQITVTDRAVISLGPNSIRMTNRRGVPQSIVRGDHVHDFHAMVNSALPQSELFVAGNQSRTLVVNLDRGAIINQIDTDSGIFVMKRSRLICCGSTSGEVTLRDSRTFKAEHRVQAHTGTMSDLDVSGNLFITCGFSYRAGSLISDPIVKVYDIRTMQPLPPIAFPMGPTMIKFHPKIPTSVFVASQSGQFQLCDVSNQSADICFHQVNVNSYINCLDTSVSGEFIGFGDASNIVHVWSDRDEPIASNYSRPLELPDPVEYPDVIVDEESPLSSVGMPYYTEPLLSVWPAHFTFEVGKPAPSIEPEVLQNMKTIDFVGYAPNPRTRLRNQIPPRPGRDRKSSDTPKFRSEQEREKHLRRLRKKSELASPKEEDISLQNNPLAVFKLYRRVEIKYSRFGVEDFDFGYYNKTHFSGLETHITNSYCNSLLQVLFFIPTLKNIAKSHVKSNCPKEFCLLCELGFLFQMLEDAKGRNCQATNFLRAFSTIPQAVALGLFEPDQPTAETSYSTLIQNFNRFILEQLHQESNAMGLNICVRKDISGNDPTLPSIIQQVFGLKTVSSNKCLCGAQIDRTTYPFAIDLVYPKNSTTSSSPPKPSSLVEILQSSISRQTQAKAWCNSCQRYQSSTQKKSLQELPNIFSVNCSTLTQSNLDLWRSSAVAGTNSWLPLAIQMELKGDEVHITNPSPQPPVHDDENNERASNVATYELYAVVSQIQFEKEIAHLVAHIKVGKSEMEDGKSEWYHFNDFMVKNIPEEEVTNFKHPWKTPSVLYFVRTDLSSKVDVSALPDVVDNTILFKDYSISRLRHKLPRSYKPLTVDEMPNPGFLCGIDAEFVAMTKEETEIWSDGSRRLIRPSRLALARVSVLRGEGPKEMIPFIDDYIATSEPVVDYLTEYSGISAGDLDPSLSKHTVVPLKAAYKKLRLLLDMGSIFVGHGLNKDFRIINIIVPPSQVIDTVDIFHIKNRHRKISLKFLAWYLLNQDIQTDMHDSIEDARTALAIYKKYLLLKEQGLFEQVLEDIYNVGMKYNWKPVPGLNPFSSFQPAPVTYATTTAGNKP
ncbi:cysteine proteinase [Basidiobolus meristosporus CBS 931.73]|uniref:PAN2-PAN3 deadenylation complex catalytic subunit PAN2 n=1 Tax=Basidiobolus meristosporus CBS 931.73 TaxID=1314790 RepID=A0A1Y1XT62_9FUNG|nr:cysteine proteinase [Basidiobolus meristosporus CBS 931.73]|eukprot:ORX88696.1 cysteine proteinase [Basidiobolus meristosporus CBS 931.73]